MDDMIALMIIGGIVIAYLLYKRKQVRRYVLRNDKIEKYFQ